MLESQPLRSPGVRLGFLMIAGVLLVDVVLLYFCLTLPFSLLSFILGLLLLLSLPVLATLFVGTRAIQRGRYHVDADLLHLDLGQAVEQIPLSAIEDIRYGHELTAKTTFRGLRWPGLYLGQGQTTLDGHERAIHYLATRPPADQLLILTTDTIYGISPADLALFRDSLKALQAGSQPTRPDAGGSSWGIAGWQIWRDRIFVSLLLAGLGLNLLQFGYLAARFSKLPAAVPLHFGVDGGVDRWGAPRGLLLLPLLGLAFWLVNGGLGLIFYHIRDNRPVAYLIWLVTIIIQLASWIALLELLSAL
ncbi:MAG: DUF1648 domain-containing protein [Anaerolineales bacterium]|nr:DUF1648 domain-containing protein [Anaerolineales bacterium]MCB0020426.1 DUF1648 domain-containing protein [Anaerolineales bacterium]MCB0030104.1 DUF1648 domain-containing protein [Anaerolineales bacterium]MCB8960703.1 DUF1648 domain-containing protein [Ardenticatenales bacterium]